MLYMTGLQRVFHKILQLCKLQSACAEASMPGVSTGDCLVCVRWQGTVDSRCARQSSCTLASSIFFHPLFRIFLRLLLRPVG